MEILLESVDEDLSGLTDGLRARPLPPADQPAMVKDITDCDRRLHERYLRSRKSQEEGVLAASARDPRTDIRELDRRTSEILESGDNLRKIFAEGALGATRDNVSERLDQHT